VIERFYENCNRARDRYQDLLEELKQIPHLPLRGATPVKTIMREVDQIQKWAGNYLNMSEVNPGFRREHYKLTQGRVLIGFDQDDMFLEDGEKNIWDHPKARFSPDGNPQFAVTGCGSEMPETLSWVRSFMPRTQITRIMRLHPGHGIYWHSHHNGPLYHKDYFYGFAITTLTTNPNVSHGVRGLEDESPEYNCHYEIGETHLFNSWFNHQVVNEGQNIRYCLQHFFNLHDADTLAYLADQVAHYRGPRINE
jgi:hypothetical protein